MEIVTEDDAIDHKRGAVYAQKMADLPDEFKGPDANPVNLFYDIRCRISGWIEGYWDDTAQEFFTNAGNCSNGVPTAWAVLPKTPEDWS
jgi:hypothetical protein